MRMRFESAKDAKEMPFLRATTASCCRIDAFKASRELRGYIADDPGHRT